jgi:hypothetical protein
MFESPTQVMVESITLIMIESLTQVTVELITLIMIESLTQVMMESITLIMIESLSQVYHFSNNSEKLNKCTLYSYVVTENIQSLTISQNNRQPLSK